MNTHNCLDIMGLEWSRNFDGVEIRHSERVACLGLTPAFIGFYIYTVTYLWDMIVGKAGGFSAVPGPEQIILVSLALSFLFALLITIFALVYVPATLLIRRDGTVTREVLGVGLSKRVGAPYFFDIREYTRATALKKISYFDLHLRGPAGSHLVTMRGDPERFRALSEFARIPVLTDRKDQPRQDGTNNLNTAPGDSFAAPRPAPGIKRGEGVKTGAIIVIVASLPFILILWLQLRQFEWREEVEISTGKTIFVRRSVTREFTFARHGIGKLKSHSIAIDDGSKEVVWKTDNSWTLDHMPLLLTYVNGAPVLVFSARGQKQCASANFPADGLVAFSFVDGAWQRMETDSLSRELRVNLLQNTFKFQKSQYHKLSNFSDSSFTSLSVDEKTAGADYFPIWRAGTTIRALSNRYTKFTDSCGNLSLRE